MLSQELTEKRILSISLWTSTALVAIEILMSIFTNSQAVLMDAAVDSVELIVVAASLLLTPLLYKPPTESRPFGYFQVESLFVIIKGFMLIGVAVSLISSNVSVILNGGREVNTGEVAIYEIALAVICLVVYIILKRMNRKLYSLTVNAELYTWKSDYIISFALSAAFMLPRAFANTSLDWLGGYFDQIVAIVLSLCIIPKPVKMIIRSFRSLLLFPPGDEKRLDIDSTVNEALARNGCQPIFIDVTETGRKIWVAVTFVFPGDSLTKDVLRELYSAIISELSPKYEGIDVEMIPLWQGYQADAH